MAAKTGPSLPTYRHTVLLSAHILAAVGWFGCGLAVTVLTVAGVAGTDPATVYPAARTIAIWLVAPLAAIAMATGLLLTALTSWGLLAHRWVTAKFAISVMLAGAIAMLLIPRLDTLATIATGPGAETLTVAQRLPLALAPATASLFLGVNVALAVAKPTRWRRHSDTLATDRS
jgi:hypothetical protein